MKNTQQPNQPEPKPAPERSRPSLGTFALYAVCISAGMLAAKFAFDAFTPRYSAHPRSSAPVAQSSPVTAAPAPATAAPRPSVVETVKKTLKNAEQYELNGLFLSGGEACALINNKIVQVGDEVDGATVVRIGEEEVELQRDNRVIRLISRNK